VIDIVFDCRLHSYIVSRKKQMDKKPDGKRKISKLCLRGETIRELTISLMKWIGGTWKQEHVTNTVNCPTDKDLGTCGACTPR